MSGTEYTPSTAEVRAAYGDVISRTMWRQRFGRLLMTEQIKIPRPHVPYGPEHVPELLADADYLDHAAANLAGGHEVGGYNVTATVIRLLHDTASALRAEHESRASDEA